jgi:alpha-L-fucosidase
MELKDFIKHTISSISIAIAESQEDLKDKGVIINPERTSASKTGELLLSKDGDRFVQNIEFDVLVGIEDSIKGNGKAGINIIPLINIGGGLSAESTTQNQQRIKFKIPIAFPTSKTPNNYTKKEGSVSWK